jgi:hypothetical protein
MTIGAALCNGSNLLQEFNYREQLYDKGRMRKFDSRVWCRADHQILVSPILWKSLKIYRFIHALRLLLQPLLHAFQPVLTSYLVLSTFIVSISLHILFKSDTDKFRLSAANSRKHGAFGGALKLSAKTLTTDKTPTHYCSINAFLNILAN